MASALARAHIAAEQRLRQIVTDAVGTTWRLLPSYDERDVEPFLARAVPIVLAGQRQSVALTDGYLARHRDRRPLGVNPDRLIGANVRRGTPPHEVYRRPFVRLWTSLKEGKPFEDAASAGLAQALGSAAMDMQLAARATFDAVQAEDEGIFGYERVADGNACAFCSEIDGAYVKSADAMALHNNCIAGDSAVWVPASRGAKASGLRSAHAATRRWYEGEVVVLETAAGHKLTVTPNHPVLTDRGWVLADLLREGDSVISSRAFDGIGGRVPGEQEVPASIEDRFRAASVSSLASVPFAPEQFHGERGDGEVDVVALHGGLDANDLEALLQPQEHSAFPFGLHPRPSLACRCGSRQRGLSRRAAPLGAVGRRGSSESLRFRLPRSRDGVLLGSRAFLDTRRSQPAVDNAPTYPVASREGQDGISTAVALKDPLQRPAAMARDAALGEGSQESLHVEADDSRRLFRGMVGEVQLDSLVLVRRQNFAAHVFNLVTSCGWYMANAIVTHNCGCSLEPLTAPHPRAATLPSGVAVNDHGELGPVLGSPDHDFTTEAQLA